MNQPDSTFAITAQQQAILAAEEEAHLIQQWQQDGNPVARDRLLKAHLRLCLKIAQQFRGYGMDREELIAEGNLGLVRAMDGFDPGKGLRFSTYAQWWIRAAMFEHVLKFSTPVSFGLSAERKRLFFKLRSLKNKLTGADSRALTPQETARIAQDLNVPRERVADMEQLLTQPTRSLDMPVGEDGLTFGALLADQQPNAEEQLAEHQELMYRRDLLRQAWTHLNERERDIVQERTLRERPLKLEELAQRYGVSRERIRQIEAAALAKLKNLISARLARQAG
jgi:RNA polymerase sigma-32 factor